jgi:hypothetical protein
MADWTPDQLRFLHDVVEIRITPLKDDGSAWPGRLIWVLEIDGRVWARSWKGEHAEWYERALVTRRARISTDDGEFDAQVQLRSDQDDEVAAKVDAEFLRKYGDPYAHEMNEPLARVTTVELVPAG